MAYRIGVVLTGLWAVLIFFGGTAECKTENLIDEVARIYGLTDADRGMAGSWKEGEMNGRRIAFQDVFGDTKIFVGRLSDNPGQMPDIILHKMDLAAPEPYPFKLQDIEGLRGTELAAQYAIRTPPGEPQTAILNMPAVRDGVPKLASAVADLTIFEIPAVELYLYKKGTTIQTIDEDLKILLAITDALQKVRTP